MAELQAYETATMRAPVVVMMTLPMLLVLCLTTNALQGVSRQDGAVSRKACPGCQWVCEDDETCCQMRSGNWGCCIMANVSRSHHHCFSTHPY